MKIKTLFFFLFTLCCAGTIMANPISESQAKAVALSFLNSNPATRLRAGQAPQLRLAYAEPTLSTPAYYIYNYGENDGYVLVSGTDQLTQVMGYGLDGGFDPANVPENFKAWLDDLTLLVGELENAPGTTLLSSAKTSTPIEPLLDNIKWNQNTPFNNMCPTYQKDGETKRSVTGCVATAMAQVMYYHKWPVHGTGSNTYTTILNSDSAQTATLTANFGSTTYDWDLMTPTYGDQSTAEEQDAVALLMHHCGIAVNMKYGSTSSSATRRAMCALPSYFGYDKGIRFMPRNCYTLQEWTQRIDQELEAARPIIYNGTTASGGGHAFVLDGRNADGYYHFNWGWGGKSNGYFVIFELSPKQHGIGGSNGGYNNSQGMTVGIQKEAGGTPGYTVYASEFYTTSTKVKKGSSVTFRTQSLVALYTNDPQVTTIVRKVHIYNSAGTIVATSSYSTSTTLDMKPGTSYSRSDYVTIPSTLPVGKYTVRVTYENTSGTIKDFVKIAFGPYQYVNMEVKSDGYAYFAEADYDTALNVDSLTLMNEALANRNLYVKTTLSNTGDEYFDDVYFAMLNGSNEVMSISDPVRVDIPTDGTLSREMVFVAPATAGTYTLAVLDADKNVISGETLSVNVGAEPLPFELSIEQALAPASTTMPASCIQGTATLKNNGGVFSGILELMILNVDNNNIVANFYTPFLTIANGESKTVMFSSPFPNGVVGKQYRMVLRDPHNTTTNKMWGSAQTFTVGEEPVTPDVTLGDTNGDGEVDLNDLTTLINYLLDKDPTPFNFTNADVNNSGEIDLNDLTGLISIMLEID